MDVHSGLVSYIHLITSPFYDRNQFRNIPESLTVFQLIKMYVVIDSVKCSPEVD